MRFILGSVFIVLCSPLFAADWEKVTDNLAKKEKATELMLQVHNEGKSIVTKGAREEMERYVQRLHEYGLWATLAREDQI